MFSDDYKNTRFTKQRGKLTCSQFEQYKNETRVGIRQQSIIRLNLIKMFT